VAPDVGAGGGYVAFVFVGQRFALWAGEVGGAERVGERQGKEGEEQSELHGCDVEVGRFEDVLCMFH